MPSLYPQPGNMINPSRGATKARRPFQAARKKKRKMKASEQLKALRGK